MNKYIYDENNGLWYELLAIITFPALLYHPKKKNLSGYGGSNALKGS